MKIVTSPKVCERIYISDGIMESGRFKKILNDEYHPDEFLFFCEGNDVVPLVMKDGLVTFYGGKISNEYNSLPDNQELLNQLIQQLLRWNYNFRLLSIMEDRVNLLYNDYKIFDVPGKVRWVMHDLISFNMDSYISSFKRKKRVRFRNYLSSMSKQYKFKTIKQTDFPGMFDRIIKLQIASFKTSQKPSGWEGREDLFIKIMNYFINEYQLLIRVLSRGEDEIGIYVIVYNNHTMILYFLASFDKLDDKLTTLLYLDIIQQAAELAELNKITTIDALRGSFTYKKRMGFTPYPLYYLVNDPGWHVMFDDDLSKDEYHSLYQRKFGCESMQINLPILEHYVTEQGE